MSAATTYSFVADPGTQQTEGELPEITQRLSELAQELHVTIYGISGYRTPAQSVAVGGFANDPHTKGLAEDIGVDSQTRASAAQLTNQELASVGLERPFDETGNDPNEVNHIQLLPLNKGRPSNAAQVQSQSAFTPALNAVSSAANTAAGVASGAAQFASDPVGSVENAALGYVEPRLEQGALYFFLIIGGVVLAGYGLIRMLAPTGAPQAIAGVARRAGTTTAEVAA